MLGPNLLLRGKQVYGGFNYKKTLCLYFGHFLRLWGYHKAQRNLILLNDYYIYLDNWVHHSHQNNLCLHHSAKLLKYIYHQQYIWNDLDCMLKKKQQR